MARDNVVVEKPLCFPLADFADSVELIRADSVGELNQEICIIGSHWHVLLYSILDFILSMAGYFYILVPLSRRKPLLPKVISSLGSSTLFLHFGESFAFLGVNPSFFRLR